MLNGHKPTDPKHTTRATIPSSALEHEETPKASRTSALRNRLSLRRHDGNPKSRTVSAQSRSKEYRAASGQGSGFLLETARNKTVAHGTENSGERAGRVISHSAKSEERQGGQHGSSRPSSPSDRHNAETPENASGPDPGVSGMSLSPEPVKRSTQINSVEANTNSEVPQIRTRLESNPAEIVDLALSLSANRRRSKFGPSLINEGSLSKARIPSQNGSVVPPSVPAVVGPSIVSDASQLESRTGWHAAGDGSIPISEAETLAEYSQPPSGLQMEGLHSLIPMAETQPSTTPGGIKPSQATMRRAEKAKARLESAYHYRRLLQQLPELPRAPVVYSRFDEEPFRSGQHHQYLTPGRTYNPLQYIRNRRVRQRDGHPLNPAAGGWEELDNVRSWVEAVADASSKDPTMARSIKTLPPLLTDPKSPAHGQQNSLDTTNHSEPSSSQKTPRLRADWGASPAELLADAHWTHDSDNRYHLVDHRGNRLFAPPPSSEPTEKRFALDRDGTDGTRGRLDRVSLDVPRPRSRDSSTREGSLSDRGRKRHGKTSSLSGPPIRTSMERYGRIPRSILRSTSPSVRSDISETPAQTFGRGFQNPDDKETPDVMLLRQQLQMLSQNSNKERGNQSSEHKRHDSFHRPQKDIDTASLSSAGEPEVSTLRKRPEPIKRSRRPVDTSEFHGLDSALSSDPETMNPKRFSKTPDIFIDSEGTSEPRPRLESAFQPFKDRPVNRLPTREVSAEMAEPGSEVDTKKANHRKVEDGSSQLDLSPSQSLMQGRDTIRDSPTFLKTPPRPRHIRKDSESRLRGFIRGSKLTELVSAPVYKVGDLIWRRVDSEHRARSSSVSSREMDKATRTNTIEADEEADPSAAVSDSGSSKAGKKTQGYHIDNLPVFRSPFKGSNTGSREGGLDHISRQQDELRKSRSNSRFEKLAPPNLDMRSVSGSPSRPGTPTEGSREHPERGSNERRQAVDIGTGDNEDFKLGTRDSGKGHSDHELGSWRLGSYSFAMAKLDLISDSRTVARRDISRLTALMTSCAVNSNEMVRWATAAHVGTVEARRFTHNQNGPLPTQKIASLQTGKRLVRDIEHSFGATRAAFATFSEEAVNDLHKQVQGLHVELSEDLTGAVRGAEMAADDLGSQLATDYTLEIKRLNDIIDLVMRRRRRRTRWLRRAGFSLLEWAVLGVMWWAWLVVVLFRLARGTVKGVYWIIRWLLWL